MRVPATRNVIDLEVRGATKQDRGWKTEEACPFELTRSGFTEVILHRLVMSLVRLIHHQVPESDIYLLA